jgi:hypothetical protein
VTQPSTVPSWTSRVAKTTAVLLRLCSNVLRTGLPGTPALVRLLPDVDCMPHIGPTSGYENDAAA